jgi:hypothetical protein
MIPLQERDALVPVFGAEPVDDVAIGVLGARPRRPKCRAGEIADG